MSGRQGRRLRGHAATVLILAALAVPVVPAALLAQPAPAAQVDEAHQLADQFLQKIGMDQLMGSVMDGSRQLMVVVLQREGLNEMQAAQVADKYLVPEFKARLPELLGRFRDILAADFTPDELRAVLSDQTNDARRSAAGKVPRMQAEFQTAGQEWGRQVGVDAFAKNRVNLEQLGVKGLGQ